jgi:hypothetical protein
MNNSGGSSSVVSRHDYLPFGEEIFAGVGQRLTTQGFATNPWANDNIPPALGPDRTRRHDWPGPHLVSQI